MADRNVKVILSLMASGFVSGAKQAEQAATGLLGKVEANKASLDTLGRTATTAGVATLAGVGMATKAAMDWETAWAGVLKTVDGTDAQIATLHESLREMARTMPATHSEIAAVAEAAGQLGVATDDVAEFTRVMIMLGETTNVTADQASTSFAQFMNVMGSSPDMVDNLASALVALGNNGASTEADILALSQRIASAGASVGMTEANVLGFAAALANVGVEAEAGGTAISMSFQQIDAAVRKGGDALEKIAATSGMSAQEFKAAWGRDAAGAAQAFIVGLGRMQESGESAKGLLDELGMSGIRQSDALMRLALSGEKFTDTMELSGQAIASTSALTDEYAKRAETTASQVQVAWNNIKDAGIEAGAVMLPVVATLAGGVAGVARAFGALPDPVKAAAVSMAAIGGTSLVAAGGFIKIVQTGAELKSSLGTVREAFPKLDAAIGKVGWKKAALGAGVLTAALVAQQVAAQANARAFDDIKVSADDLAAKLLKAGDAGKTLNEAFTLETRGLFSGVTKEVDGLGDALQRVLKADAGQQFEDLFNGMLTGRSAAEQMRLQFVELDNALAQLASGGNGEQAAAMFDQVAEAAIAQGIPVEDLARLFPEYAGALRDAAGAAGAAATGAQLLAGGLGEAADEGEAAYDAMMRLGSAMLQLSGTEMGLEAAIDDATDSLKEHGATLDIGTAAGRANKGALDNIASSALNLREAQLKAGASTETMNASTNRARDAFIQAAQKMGLTADEAANLANKYGLIPKTVHTNVTATIQDPDVSAMLRRTQARINANPLYVPTRTSAMTYRASGGPVYGAGTATSDSIPAMLSNGEYVIRAASVAKLGMARLDWLNRFGELPRFATGGQVASAPIRYAPNYSPPPVYASSQPVASGSVTLSLPTIVNERFDPMEASRQIAWHLPGTAGVAG